MAIVAMTCASLRLWGDDLLPDEFTRLLGQPPSMARRKGDPMQTLPSHPPARTGSWTLSTEKEEGDALDMQIASILSCLTADLSVWNALAKRFDIDMFCGVWLDEAGQGLALEPDTLQLMGARGIKLELDIYYPDEA